MHARVATVQVQLDKMEEFVNIYGGPVLAAGQQMPGFKGGILLTDPSSNKAISIALWESEAAMQAGESSDYYRQQVARVGPVVAGPPVTEHFEISLFEV